MEKLHLEDRMLIYKSAGGNKERFLPGLPVCCMIDGRAFHSFCKGFHKPFDFRIMDLMDLVTLTLVKKTGAVVGYTQSDEINLVFFTNSFDSSIFFDGRKHKMISVLASITTEVFVKNLPRFKSGLENRSVNFDCTCWQVPTKFEATNFLVWRQNDAIRNSILSLGQSLFSHNQLQGKKCSEVSKMVKESFPNSSWESMKPRAKYGCWFKKIRGKKKFSSEEIEKLPPKHEARSNPDLEVERNSVIEISTPFLEIESEYRAAAVFNKERSALERSGIWNLLKSKNI